MIFYNSDYSKFACIHGAMIIDFVYHSSIPSDIFSFIDFSFINSKVIILLLINIIDSPTKTPTNDKYKHHAQSTHILSKNITPFKI